VCTECGRLLRDWHGAVVVLADCIDQAEKSTPNAFEERYTAVLLAREIAETAHMDLLLHRKQHLKRVTVCEQSERLQKIYLDAVADNALVGSAIADPKSEAWLEATTSTRQRCADALADLTAHRKEHGC
jgi:hypothetical protein